MNCSSSAPGKLFLMGEYAVLDGAPALVQAVNRRARVGIRSSSSPGVRIRASGESAGDLHSTPLLQAVIQGLDDHGLCGQAMVARLEIELDTSAFFHGDRKLGLGSSAALMVALIKALVPSGGLSDTDFLALARYCHAAFQGGKGSGADIATSLMGGCIRFRTNGYPARIDLPHDLHMLFIWSGEVGVTPTYLNRLDDWRRREPVSSRQRLEALARISGDAIADLESGRTGRFIAAVDEFNAALMELSDAGALGSYTAVHRGLNEMVRAAGCSYKPSGGGGDFGIAFSRDREQIQGLNELLTHKGFFTLTPEASVPASEVLYEE